MSTQIINGFSKLSREEKIKWLENNFLTSPDDISAQLYSFLHQDCQVQKVLDGFSENTICNFPMPYGLAPNFLIDGKMYCVPMVIEESSVVAAASSAAKYWAERGGFHTEILGTIKVGQLHFKWNGSYAELKSIFPVLKEFLITSSAHLTANMEKRGGGLRDMELLDFSHVDPGLYQIRAHFDTKDSMGANFINSVLEQYADALEAFFVDYNSLPDEKRDVQIIMAILSNHTPECVVMASVSCPVSELGTAGNGMLAEKMAEKFRVAVQIARNDPYRATTHNKGIYNGVDAVVLATGNDFRAVESAGHTYAAMSGQYKSLSQCEIEDGIFRFWLEIPLALGTVGGLTSLHPLAKLSLQILGNPGAEELMRIIAAVGLAQNFAAVRSLVTTGIQKGHMKMHLLNILNHLNADQPEIEKAYAFFADKTISYAAVRTFLESMRVSVS
jgi:hydroxymethylglutaryl-CoA reductase